jgi:hypothetical protein
VGPDRAALGCAAARAMATLAMPSCSESLRQWARTAEAPPGVYVVTAKLPERDGEFEYHIKHTSELHERIAKESELHEARR